MLGMIRSRGELDRYVSPLGMDCCTAMYILICTACVLDGILPSWYRTVLAQYMYGVRTVVRSIQGTISTVRYVHFTPSIGYNTIQYVKGRVMLPSTRDRTGDRPSRCRSTILAFRPLRYLNLKIQLDPPLDDESLLKRGLGRQRLV